jgi:hypothetical protein
MSQLEKWTGPQLQFVLRPTQTQSRLCKRISPMLQIREDTPTYTHICCPLAGFETINLAKFIGRECFQKLTLITHCSRGVT